MNMYEMKNSNIAWIKEIPYNWNILHVKDGFNIKKSKAQQTNPVVLTLARSGVKIRDMTNGEGQFATSYFDYNPVSIDDMLLNPMDLISGDNCSLSKVSGVISPAYVNLRYKNGFSPEYYKYYFKYQYWCKAFFAHGKGVSFDNRWTINNETLMKFPLLVPPLETQKAIANFLDQRCSEIDGIYTDIEKEINILEEYKKSVITEAVTKGLHPDVEMKDSGIEWIGMIPSGWDVKPLKYVVKYNCRTLPENTQHNYEFDYVDIGSVTYGKGIEHFQRTTFGNAPSRARRIVQKDDVILSTVRTYLKATAGIPDNELPIIVSTGFITLTANKYINSKYLKYIAQFDAFVSEVECNSVGVSYPAINPSEIVKIKIIIPPISEQKEIADYLDAKCSEIDAIISDKKNQLATLTEYKKSLIYEYVTDKKQIV